jgi:RimJ/RimL family protein N-acetyltransferase
MAHPWPLFDLAVRIDDLELRLPSDEDLVELADVAAAGVHPPDVMPFEFPWTDAEPEVVRRRVLQYHWGVRGQWSPERWRLELGVRERGRLVGVQAIGADAFAVTRTVGTGSWLGQPFQGRGIGRRMRLAVLALAFDHLEALVAESGAFLDNPASAAVSRAIGYEENGIEVRAPRGVRKELVRYRLTAERWRASERPRVEVTRLEPCLPLFGLG